MPIPTDDAGWPRHTWTDPRMSTPPKESEWRREYLGEWVDDRMDVDITRLVREFQMFGELPRAWPDPRRDETLKNALELLFRIMAVCTREWTRGGWEIRCALLELKEIE